MPTRPVADIIASHSSTVPEPRSVTVPVPPFSAGGLTSAKSPSAAKTRMPSRSIRSSRASCSERSIPQPSMRFASRMQSVTSAPSDRKMNAYSVLIVPPPWMTRWLGTRPMSLMVSPS